MLDCLALASWVLELQAYTNTSGLEHFLFLTTTLDNVLALKKMAFDPQTLGSQMMPVSEFPLESVEEHSLAFMYLGVRLHVWYKRESFS